METFISVHDKHCRLAFLKLIEASERDQKASDQYDRYKIWASNVGAGHTGQTYKKSLDYQLRETHLYRDQIINILKPSASFRRSGLHQWPARRRVFF